MIHLLGELGGLGVVDLDPVASASASASRASSSP